MKTASQPELAGCSTEPASSPSMAIVILGLALLVPACGRTALLAPGDRDASRDGLATSPVISDDGPDLSPDSSQPTSSPSIDGGCPAGFTACGRGAARRCFDLRRSTDHCGQCETSCAPGILCQASRCQQYACKGTLSFKALPASSQAPSSGEDEVYAVTVLGDFDGDGTLDFVGEPQPGAPMGLLLGNGDGTFRSHALATAFSKAWNAAAADLNGDGRLDLASIAKDEASVTVRLGNGDPTTLFEPATSYPTPSAPGGLLLADLDDDGHVDLVTAQAQRLTLWHGSSSGQFDPPVNVPVGLAEPVGINPLDAYLLRAVDWSQDGVLDLLYGINALRILPGIGDGTFGKEITCGLALGFQQPNGIVADFDHDRKPDLALIAPRGAQLYLGMTTCNYATSVPIPSASPYGAIDSLAVADLDGDGTPDVIVADTGSTAEQNHLSVALSDGRGGFASPLAFPIRMSFSPTNLLFGDVNHDTKLDIIVTRSEGWQVLLNTCP